MNRTTTWDKAPLENDPWLEFLLKQPQECHWHAESTQVSDCDEDDKHSAISCQSEVSNSDEYDRDSLVSEHHNLELLLRSYLEAFAWDDEVVLVIHVTGDINEHIEKELLLYIDNIKDEYSTTFGASKLPKILPITQELSDDERVSLYKAAHAFVLPSRGEASCRTILEAMSMALPVISTFWGCATEYMTAKNSLMLGYGGVVSRFDSSGTHRMYADPSKMELISFLRQSLVHAGKAKSKGLQAREDIVTQFSSQHGVDIIESHLSRISRDLDS